VGEHPAPVFEQQAQPATQLVHPLARVAHHRDLEERLAHLHALSDRPGLYVHPLDGDVLARGAGLDSDRVQMLLRGEQHLAARRIAMGTALEPLALDREHALARFGAAAFASRRDEKSGHGCHPASLSIESEPS